MKRFVSVILMLLAATFLFGAFAEPDNTADPVPQDLMHRLWKHSFEVSGKTAA